MNWNEYFTYNAETGELRWRARPLSHFSSEKAMKCANARAGKIAGGERFGENGRVRGIYVQINGNTAAAKIIWEMHNGPLPSGMVIDHIDRNPLNNRMSNLRPATRKQNSYNSVKPKRNLPQGVYATKKGDAWRVRIMVDGKNLWVGSFRCVNEAHEAYKKASLRHFGDFSIYSTAKLNELNTQTNGQDHQRTGRCASAQREGRSDKG